MRVITFYLILITFEILSQCARVCVCIIYKNNIDESVTQETFHEAKVLSFELQSDDYKIEKKPENSSSPSTWLNTFVLVRDADFIMILRSRVSSFLFTVKKKGERRRFLIWPQTDTKQPRYEMNHSVSRRIYENDINVLY